jgi:hypothetical protein
MTHILLRVVLVADDREDTADLLERLMGTKAEPRSPSSRNTLSSPTGNC